MLQQYPRFGAPIDLPLLLPLAALQASVHLARSWPAAAAPASHSACRVSGSRASNSAAAPSTAPTRDSPPLPTPLPEPKLPACRLRLTFWWPPHPLFSRTWAVQLSNRVLAVVTSGYAEFVDQHRSLLPSRLVVSLIHHPEVLPLRLVSQTHLPLKFCTGPGLHPTCLDGLPSGYILDGAIATLTPIRNIASLKGLLLTDFPY